MKKRMIGLLGLLAAGSVYANIVVSVTGTANNTEMGYTSGQSYTFTWVLNAGYTGSSFDNFTEEVNFWDAEHISDPLLWTSVSGDGLAGSYSRPYVDAWAPYDVMKADAFGLALTAANDFIGTADSMGLTANGEEVLDMTAYDLNIGAIDYSETSFVNPAAWLNSYVGTFAQSSGVMRLIGESAGTVYFTPTSVTIAAIPEPASAMMLIFGAGVGMVIHRARRSAMRR